MFSTSRPSRTAALVGITAACALLMSACSSSSTPSSTSGSDSGELTKVGMSTNPWLGYGPWYIAQQEGYFADNGVDVSMVNVGSEAEALAAFASGSVQMANTASQNAFKLIDEDIDVSIVLLLDASLEGDAILVDGSISSVADLAGKSVAYEEGSVSNILLGYVLQQNGLTLADITTVPMTAGDAATALIGGSVPAAVTYEPYISQAQGASEDLKVLITAAEEVGLISDVLVVDNTFLAENPEAVQGVVNAWGESIDFYKSKTEEAQNIIAEGIGIEAEALRPAFAGVQYFSLQDNTTELGGNYLEVVLPSILDIASQIGLTEGAFDLPSMVNTTFVENAE